MKASPYYFIKPHLQLCCWEVETVSALQQAVDEDLTVPGIVAGNFQLLP